MSEAALKTVRSAETVAVLVRDFIKKEFPGLSFDSMEIIENGMPPAPVKNVRTPDDVSKELVDVLFPELRGDFSSAGLHRRSIATITIKQWAYKLVEDFREAIEAGVERRKQLNSLLDLAKELVRSQEIQLQELQGDLKQAVELRGVHADKAKEELAIKLANAERNHAADRHLLQLALAERDEARGELAVEKGKAIGLAADLSLVMTAVSGNAEAPKKADAYLAAAVEKCHEFWGENARRSPTAQLVLGDVIKARVALQPLTLVNGKTEQAKTA